MKLTKESLRKAVMSACVAGAFIPMGAGAADDTQSLKAEIDALKKEIQELRGLVKGSRDAAATKQEVTALQKEVREAKEASMSMSTAL